MFPLSRRIRVERWKLVLDAAMVLAGGAVLVWYFAIRPTAEAHGDSATLTLLTYAFPLASFMLLLGITTVLLRGPLDRNREAFSCLVGGILVSIVSDLAFDLVLLETGERSASWTDGVYMLSYLLLIASAELYWRRPVAKGWTTADQEPRPQVLSPLPYLAAAAVFWLLVANAHASLDRPRQRAGRWARRHRDAPDGHPPGGGRAPERAPAGGNRRPPGRGALPVPGPELVRRDHPGRRRRQRHLREPVGVARAAL